MKRQRRRSLQQNERGLQCERIADPRDRTVLAVRRARRLGGPERTLQPTLITNPADDRAFQEAAEAEVATGAATSEELQACLRRRYPRAVVHARELAGERILVWYVYREGRWVSSHAARGANHEV